MPVISRAITEEYLLPVLKSKLSSKTETSGSLGSPTVADPRSAPGATGLLGGRDRGAGIGTDPRKLGGLAALAANRTACRHLALL